MSLSLAAESRRKGVYEPYFWSRALAPSSHNLIPLLFPEPLPVVTLINRDHIWRGRLESNAAQLSDVQALRNAETILQPAATRKRRSFAASASRDGSSSTDIGGTVIPLFDGELLLLVQPGSDSRPSSTSASRPPSTSVETGSIDKPISRVPSIRVRPGSSQGVERKTSLARRNSLPSMSQRTSLVIPEHPTERTVRVVVQAGTLDRLVEVLAHGLPNVTVSFADDNGEMPLRESKTREVRLDRAEFMAVWWNTFRSFISPLVFFEVGSRATISLLLFLTRYASSFVSDTSLYRYLASPLSMSSFI